MGTTQIGTLDLSYSQFNPQYNSAGDSIFGCMRVNNVVNHSPLFKYAQGANSNTNNNGTGYLFTDSFYQTIDFSNSGIYATYRGMFSRNTSVVPTPTLTTVSFANCTNLSVIGRNTFSYQSALTTIDFSGCPITEVSSSAFAGCTALQTIYCDGPSYNVIKQALINSGLKVNNGVGSVQLIVKNGYSIDTFNTPILLDNLREVDPSTVTETEIQQYVNANINRIFRINGTLPTDFDIASNIGTISDVSADTTNGYVSFNLTLNNYCNGSDIPSIVLPITISGFKANTLLKTSSINADELISSFAPYELENHKNELSQFIVNHQSELFNNLVEPLTTSNFSINNFDVSFF